MTPLTAAERELVDRYRGLASTAARRAWVRAHRIPDINDLNQAAMLGLCEAARMFDPSRGFRFSTYGLRSAYNAALREATTSGVIATKVWMNRAAARDNPLLALAAAARYPIQFTILDHDRTSSGDPDLEASTNRIDVDELLEAIDVTDRELVRRWMRGQSYAAIGAAAGMRPLTAKYRIHQALGAIRRRFGGRGNSGQWPVVSGQ
jgi:RNA polymerase sigma factor (sigma-70 family)